MTYARENVMLIQLNNPELIAFVYPNAEAVVEETLTHAMESEHLTEEDIRAIEESEAQFARGEFVDFDVFAAEMRKKYGIK
jgi:hypothetical protein